MAWCNGGRGVEVNQKYLLGIFLFMSSKELFPIALGTLISLIYVTNHCCEDKLIYTFF